MHRIPIQAQRLELPWHPNSFGARVTSCRESIVRCLNSNRQPFLRIEGIQRESEARTIPATLILRLP